MPESLDILQRLRRRELLILARRAGIRRPSHLKKEELVRALAGSVGTAPAEGATRGSPIPSKWEDVPLPEGYGGDRLALLPIDPYWVHAYWELTADPAVESRDSPEGERGSAPSVLRVYDVTFIDFDGSNAHSFFDIALTPDARNWYINLWSPEKSLCAELGRIQPDGTFAPRVRSNVIDTPPAWPSPHGEEHWMRVEWSQEARGVGQSEGSSEIVRSVPQPVPHALSPDDSDLRASSGRMKSLRRPAEFMRAEDLRRFFERLRRARILGTDPGFSMRELVEDSEAGPSSGQWIRQTERGRRVKG